MSDCRRMANPRSGVPGPIYGTPEWREWFAQPENRHRAERVAKLDERLMELLGQAGWVALERHSLLGGWSVGLPVPSRCCYSRDAEAFAQDLGDRNEATPPPVRMVVVVAFRVGSGPEFWSELHPVVMVERRRYNPHEHNGDPGHFDEDRPAAVRPGFAGGHHFRGIEPIIVAGKAGYEPVRLREHIRDALVDGRATRFAAETIACPWPESEDARRLADADLGVIGSVMSDVALSIEVA